MLPAFLQALAAEAQVGPGPLSPYFSSFNLDDIEIHEGIPWHVRAFSEIDPSAYTSGNDIYADYLSLK